MKIMTENVGERNAHECRIMRGEDMTNKEAVKLLEKGSLAYGEVEAKAFCEAYDMAIKALEGQPKTGHWIEVAKYSDGKHKIECSECGNYIFDRGHANSQNVKDKYKYCPNCGAKMEEADNGRQ